MRKLPLLKLTATCATVAVLASCAPPTQESCSLYPNQTLGGALIGAGIGTAIGAAASHGSGGGMLVGAAVGMLVGAAIGQQQDQACYQLALRTAFEQAEAERRAWEAQVAAAQAQAQAQAQAEAEAREQAAAAQARARARARQQQQQAAAETPPPAAEAPPAAQYKPVSWRNANTGHGGTITPTNSFTDQATGRNCWSFEDRPINADGTSGPPVTRRACMGADGNVIPAN